jgi:5-methylcytosine-specific restriction endonuclease McrA
MPYKDPEKQKAANREAQSRWRKRNPLKRPSKEKQSEYQKKWREAHPEENREMARTWAKENPEGQAERCRRWTQAHPEWVRERSRKRRAMKKRAMGWMPPYPEGILFGKQAGLCLYCSADLEQSGWHMEHKIPLSRGGKHDWNNVCLSCPGCNQSKFTKTDTEFMV